MLQLVCIPDHPWTDYDGKARSLITNSSFYLYNPKFDLYENYKQYADRIGLTLFDYYVFENIEEPDDNPPPFSEEYLHDWNSAYWTPNVADLLHEQARTMLLPVFLQGIVNYARANDFAIILNFRGEKDARNYIQKRGAFNFIVHKIVEYDSQKHHVEHVYFECLAEDLAEVYTELIPNCGRDVMGFVMKRSCFEELKMLYLHSEGERDNEWAARVLEKVVFQFDHILDLIGFRISGISLDMHKFIVDAKLKELNDVMKDLVIPE